MGVGQGGLGHQEVEVAQDAPTMVRIQSVHQPDRALQQHGLDVSSIQDAHGSRELISQLDVALLIGGADGIEKCAEFLVQRCAEPKIVQSCGKRGQDEVRARMAYDALPMDASLAHERPQLFGRLAASQPRYQAGASLEQGQLTTAQAFAELCHARSMLDREPEVLAETLRWVESAPAFRLAYGDLDRAVNWALSLLAVK